MCEPERVYSSNSIQTRRWRQLAPLLEGVAFVRRRSAVTELTLIFTLYLPAAKLIGTRASSLGLIQAAADREPRVIVVDLNDDGDDDLFVPSGQGSCFVERSFLEHGYAQGRIVRANES
jgi:hypothetical protein